MTITAEHSSGRFDVEPAILEVALAQQLVDEPDFLSLTEMMSEARAAVLGEFPAYTVVRHQGADGQDECALLVRSAAYRVVSSRAVKLSDLPIPLRGGKFCFALHVAVEDVITKERHHRLVVHMPSGVEGVKGFRDSAQARVYRNAIGGLREYVATLTGPVVITGDWNLDLRKRWVREYLTRALPGFIRTWNRTNLPDIGTHGSRVIDYSLMRGFSVSRATVRSSFGASDHRTIREHHERKATVVTKVQIYPGADRSTQWFADNYPGDNFDTNCGVLHTTEGTDWPTYEGGATAPNLTAKPDIANKRLNWRQHFPMDMSSRALRNEAGGVETNTLNVSQVELVGTCDPRHRTSWNGQGRLLAGKHYIYWPDAPDWLLVELAKFLRWCNTEHGIPLSGAKTWLPYPKSYGSAAGNRFTFAQWQAFTGWCGHQHVPENSHGDPGDINFARLLELAAPVTPSLPTADIKPTHVETARDNIRDAYRSLRLAIEELEAAGDNRTDAKAWIPTLKSARRQLGIVLQADPER